MVEVSIVSRFQKEDERLDRIMSLLGHSWAPQILHRLDYYGKMRYNEIKGSLRNISSTSLSRALNILTSRELLERKVTDTNPPQVFYSLTNKGKELAKLLHQALETERKISETGDGEAIEALIS